MPDYFAFHKNIHGHSRFMALDNCFETSEKLLCKTIVLCVFFKSYYLRLYMDIRSSGTSLRLPLVITLRLGYGYTAIIAGSNRECCKCNSKGKYFEQLFHYQIISVWCKISLHLLLKLLFHSLIIRIRLFKPLAH